MTNRLELVEEFRIAPHVREQIRVLLRTSFADSEFTRSRTYLKQLPQRRLLSWKDNSLTGHMGIEHRVIGCSTGPATVFGVIDLCVSTNCRGSGLASEMLHHLEQSGRTHHIDFIILFAHDDRLYLKNGYHKPGNRLRWLKIDEHETIGVGEEVLGEMMVKEIGTQEWPNGLVDLLGYQF